MLKLHPRTRCDTLHKKYPLGRNSGAPRKYPEKMLKTVTFWCHGFFFRYFRGYFGGKFSLPPSLFLPVSPSLPLSLSPPLPLSHVSVSLKTLSLSLSISVCLSVCPSVRSSVCLALDLSFRTGGGIFGIFRGNSGSGHLRPLWQVGAFSTPARTRKKGEILVSPFQERLFTDSPRVSSCVFWQKRVRFSFIQHKETSPNACLSRAKCSRHLCAKCAGKTLQVMKGSTVFIPLGVNFRGASNTTPAALP